MLHLQAPSSPTVAIEVVQAAVMAAKESRLRYIVLEQKNSEVSRDNNDRDPT